MPLARKCALLLFPLISIIMAYSPISSVFIWNARLVPHSIRKGFCSSLRVLKMFLIDWNSCVNCCSLTILALHFADEDLNSQSICRGFSSSLSVSKTFLIELNSRSSCSSLIMSLMQVVLTHLFSCLLLLLLGRLRTLLCISPFLLFVGQSNILKLHSRNRPHQTLLQSLHTLLLPNPVFISSLVLVCLQLRPL